MTKQETYEYNIGDKVMLKCNLLIVEITDRRKDKKKNMYYVKYSHLENAQSFYMYEEELEREPVNYNQLIFNAYIEYKYKYDKLLERLYSPAVRDKY